MKQLNETVGSCEFDNLIYQGSPALDVFNVTLRGTGADTKKALKRGTVLALSDIDGKCVALGTAAKEFSTDELQKLGYEAPEEAQTETLTANCILCDDIEVGKDDIFTPAYRTGHFNRTALIVEAEYKLTATDEEELRKGGILLSTAL